MLTALEYYEGASMPGGVTRNKLRDIAAWLDALPDDVHGEDHLLSCHVVVRVVKEAFNLTEWSIGDGIFMRPGQRHSWLEIIHNHQKFVLDVYPIASCGGPLLVNASAYGSPWRDMYIPLPHAYESSLANFERDSAQVLARAKKPRIVTVVPLPVPFEGMR